jgi:uncharacterized membrane protein YkvA (DUF1232 family)
VAKQKQYGLFTVGDLRRKMKKDQMSAEQVSALIPISNMTIRRLLRQPDTEPIPEKYIVHMASLLSDLPHVQYSEGNLNLNDMDGMISHLMDLTKTQSSLKDVKNELKEKLTKESFDGGFLTMVKELLKWATQKDNIKASLIAIGALLYFINPFDLIPDYLGPVGYLDDLGVMTLALHKIRSLKK